MPNRRVLSWNVLAVLIASVALIGVPTLGFWPGYHYDACYSILNEWLLDRPGDVPARFSWSAVMFLAFFSIEVDLSAHCEGLNRPGFSGGTFT